jgi:fatty-acyl-CoA synthase
MLHPCGIDPILDTTVGGIVRETAERAGARIGLVAAWPGVAARRVWTYAEIVEESERAARALLERFDPGERVAVWAPNIPEWLFLQFGAALAGMTLVTVNPAYRAPELAYVLQQAEAVGLFLVGEYRGNRMAEAAAEARPRLAALRDVVFLERWDEFCATGTPGGTLPHVSPDDVTQIQFTSGTTGRPKAAMLHHRGLTNNGRLVAERIGLTQDDVLLNPNPLFHVAGSGFMNLGAVQSAATQVLCPFDPGLVLALVEDLRATHAGAPPTMLDVVLAHPERARRDLSSLRVLNSGGMSVPAALVRRVESELGAAFAIGYGQTEACGLSHHVRLDDTIEDKAQTVGPPLPGVDVCVREPSTGAVLPAGHTGELCLRGYQVMAGYFRMPAETDQTIDRDGWLHTGDLASVDDRGYCRIEGRLKEMIIRGGENIYPQEIEQVLARHPSVAAAAVVGVPDERYGEQVAAFVVPVEGRDLPTADRLIEYCRRELAPFKVPRRVEIVEALPVTPLGKVQKYLLREMLGG